MADKIMNIMAITIMMVVGMATAYGAYTYDQPFMYVISGMAAMGTIPRIFIGND